jgi:tRNA pseudouridine55 synthase
MITKETTDFSGLDFQSGQAILIDKPLNYTSFQAIYHIRKAINVKKVGHAGTLDPKATGLLIICTGKMTKAITSFQDEAKTYTGSITLGKTTPSMDTETEFSESLPTGHITEEMILETRDSFLGETFQIPPMYSAVKHNGKSLYKLARKGKTVEREPRRITISKFEIVIKPPEIFFEIDCTKGTYIRVIAHDFGQKLGCGAFLSGLRRIKIGEYSVDNALSIQEFVEKADLLKKTSSC